MCGVKRLTGNYWKIAAFFPVPHIIFQRQLSSPSAILCRCKMIAFYLIILCHRRRHRLCRRLLSHRLLMRNFFWIFFSNLRPFFIVWGGGGVHFPLWETDLGENLAWKLFDSCISVSPTKGARICRNLIEIQIRDGKLGGRRDDVPKINTEKLRHLIRSVSISLLIRSGSQEQNILQLSMTNWNWFAFFACFWSAQLPPL